MQNLPVLFHARSDNDRRLPNEKSSILQKLQEISIEFREFLVDTVDIFVKVAEIGGFEHGYINKNSRFTFNQNLLHGEVNSD